MRTLAAIVAIMISTAQGVHARPASLTPIEAFGRLPAVADAAISPDGSKVALVVSDGPSTGIVVYDLDNRRGLFTVPAESGAQLRSVDWVTDERVSFQVSWTVRPNDLRLPQGVQFTGRVRRLDYWRNGVIALADQRMQFLTVDSTYPWADSGTLLVAPIEGEPDQARLIGFSRNAGYWAVHAVNLNNGRVRLVNPPGVGRDTSDFVINERGRVVARLDSNPRSNRWSIHGYQNDRPRLLLDGVSSTGAGPRVYGLLPDGRLALIDDEIEFPVITALSMQDGASEVVFAREGYEVTHAIRDPWTRRIVGAGWTETESLQHYFDADLQRAYEQARSAFEDGVARLVSWSQDRRRALIYAERALDGGGYYLMVPAENRMELIAMRYPHVAQSEFGVRLSISYRARDGVSIPAYLTLPEAETRNAPLVVLVHGGPHARDDMDFDWWASFLASRGYAVLQPNFRGSSGYGRSWEHAGRRQWGRLMQTDVEDGVVALERGGIAAAGRACIVGASYGGYAALAGAALTPTRYRCAASIAGVADLEAMLREYEGFGVGDSVAADHWRLSIGDLQGDRADIRSVSPANLAERVQGPVLLIHGADDTVVPIEQSRMMLRALEREGKNVRFVELRGDDHWLSDAETRIQMLRELEGFLAQHLGDAGG